MAITEKDFDTWTPEDEKNALATLREDAQVKKHIIKGDSYYALTGSGRIIPLSLRISTRDARGLASADTDEENGMRVMQRLAKKAGYQHELTDLPVQEMRSLIADYVAVLDRTVGDLGKSSDSAGSQTGSTETR